MNRGDGERIRDIVEAGVGGLIPRQQRLRIKVDSKQIADGVLVFGAIQPVDRIRAPRSSDPATAR